MRTFAWIIVSAGIAIAAGALLLAWNDQQLFRVLCAEGMTWACDRTANPSAGLIVAASVVAFGILILAIRPPRAKAAVTVDCPFCAQPIKPEAIRCPHCRSDLGEESAPPVHDARWWNDRRQ